MKYPILIRNARGDQRIIESELEHTGYPDYEPQLLDDRGQPWRADVHAFPPTQTKGGLWTRKRGRK